ncbi:hypothetical protein [Sulfurisphaera javensis]
MSTREKELVYAEEAGDEETVESIINNENETQFSGFINKKLIGVISVIGIATAQLGFPFMYLLQNQKANTQTKCNGEMQQKINQEYHNRNSNFIKSVAPALASSNTITSEAYNTIISSQNQAEEAVKMLIRQGVLIRTITPSGNPIMVYIGGISQYWAAGKVSAYQYGAERRLNYNKNIRQSILGIRINKKEVQIGVLVGTERAEQEWVNPVNPVQQYPYSASIITYKTLLINLFANTPEIVTKGTRSHYYCNECLIDSAAASSKYPYFTELFNVQTYFSSMSSALDNYIGLGVPGDSFDTYYTGSPVYVSGNECGSPVISGFVTDVVNVYDVLNDLAKLSGKNFDDIISRLKLSKDMLKSSAFLSVIPPPNSWSYQDIFEWAKMYLGYDDKLINSMVNFAVILGILLSKYSEEIADEIEDRIYDGNSYPCLDYNECYNYLSKFVDDIYNLVKSEASEKEFEALHICRSQAIEVDENCVNSCFNQVYERLKNLPYYTQWHLGAPDDEGLREAAKAQCEYICSKFNMSKYEECLKNLYPRKGPHIGEI